MTHHFEAEVPLTKQRNAGDSGTVHPHAAQMNRAPWGCGERRRAWRGKSSGSSIIHAGSLIAAPRGGGRQPLPTYPVCCVPSVRRNAGYVNRFRSPALT